jgi:GT2 family glycosyltransferase
VTRSRYPSYEVYLIDNGSSDDSVEYVSHAYPSVKIIRNSTNLGLTTAYNLVVPRVDAEYVVFLNNDTEVLNPGWISSLVTAASEGSHIGAVACKMLSMQNPRLLDSVGSVGIPYWKGGFFDIGRREPDTGQYGTDFEPFAYCGGAALIRKSAFIDVEGLDPEFFLYYDDPDLSWRLRLRGWNVAYDPSALVAHYRGGTAGGGELTPLILYYCHRNFLRSIIKNCGSSLIWALRNYFLFTFLVALGSLVYEPKKSIVLMKGSVWNICKFKSSYAARQAVQGRRRVGEGPILRRMYPGLRQDQTPDHVGLARVVDILLDWAGKGKFQELISQK